jgi:hypothetical protein
VWCGLPDSWEIEPASWTRSCAEALGVLPDRIVSRAGFARLLAQQPISGADVSATAGVQLMGDWADAVAQVCRAVP